MKKIVAVLFAFIFAVSLASCGAKSDKAVSETESAELPETEATEETATVSEPATETQAEAETETVTETATKIKVTAADAKAAYKKTLNGLLNSQEYDSACFTLIYVDGDDVPELVFSPATFHPSLAKLYSFDGKKVIDNGGFGEYGMFYYAPKKGLILSRYSGSGSSLQTFYRFENNNVLPLSSVESVLKFGEDKETYEYYINDEIVPREAYESEVARYGLFDEFKLAPCDLYEAEKSGLPKGVYAMTKENINKF